MVTRWIFTAGVVAAAAQRLAELPISRRHEQALLARGGRRIPEDQRPMRAVHTGWLLASLAEVHLLRRPWHPGRALAAAAVYAAGQALRAHARRMLGERWTVTVVVVPHAPRVRRGLYARLPHPNYLGVVLEIAALPLVHGAWITALTATAANAWVLARRIRLEDRALAAAGA